MRVEAAGDVVGVEQHEPCALAGGRVAYVEDAVGADDEEAIAGGEQIEVLGEAARSVRWTGRRSPARWPSASILPL